MKKSNAENTPVVLQILPELEMGGVEIGTTEIADALCKAGIKNFVASKGGRLVHDLQKMKVKHFTLDLKIKNPLKIYCACSFQSTGMECLLGGKKSRRSLYDHISRNLWPRTFRHKKIL